MVVGASAGGVEALAELVSELPADLPAALFIVLHIMPTGTSYLPGILTRRGRLPATTALDGEPIEHGHIYVAPPDSHLLVGRRNLRVAPGPREHGHRPAVDVLFRSAARAHGPAVVAIVLSGLLDDGTAGLSFVKSRGGMAVVQDPEDALFPGMPHSAISHVEVDHVLPVRSIAGLVTRLVRVPADGEAEEVDRDRDPAELEFGAAEHDGAIGLTCPECGGALWEEEDGGSVRFICPVGHVYSPASLIGQQAGAVEATLWSALRGLEERVALMRRLADRMRLRSPQSAERFEQRAASDEKHGILIREVVEDLARPGHGDEE